MASSQPTGVLHSANDQDGQAWEEEVFKKYLADLKRSKVIHEGQRGVKICLEMLDEAHTKYDNKSDYWQFFADLSVHLIKELKESAIERHALVKRNGELVKRNQELEQQLTLKLTCAF